MAVWVAIDWGGDSRNASVRAIPKRPLLTDTETFGSKNACFHRPEKDFCLTSGDYFRGEILFFWAVEGRQFPIPGLWAGGSFRIRDLFFRAVEGSEPPV